jgi:acyl-CoA synthetase (AMP-forming)/AMP-acid ligase II
VTVDAANGELLAGGDSLMTGYWGRDDDTGRAFVTVEGKRYYRTGDRVSLAPDGKYLFLGRLDRQVKRRGFRIELGEIEAALARHEGLLEAAAVATEVNTNVNVNASTTVHIKDGRMGTVITAFVRARSGGAVTLLEAKAHCARTLPPYMLPDNIVFLDALPKGSRGKIDYIALGKIAEALEYSELDQEGLYHGS